MYWLNNKAITRYVFSLFFNAADFAGKSVVFCKVLKNFWYYFSPPIYFHDILSQVFWWIYPEIDVYGIILYPIFY